jgi:adenine-specific DNA-methyltransferase
MIGADSNSIVLDFFSGSATTAHAVMQLNAEDGGNPEFIMVQLPEETDPKSEAYKAGYKKHLRNRERAYPKGQGKRLRRS